MAYLSVHHFDVLTHNFGNSARNKMKQGRGVGAGVARSRGNEPEVGVGVGVDQTASNPTLERFV